MLHYEFVRQQLLVVGSSVDVLLETHIDETLEGLGEDAGRQRWRVLGNDLLQLLERRSPGGIWKPSSRHLNHADAQRPHIASDIIVGDAGALRIDPLWSHVRLAAGIDCFCDRVHQIPGNAEITHFDFAATVDH